MAAGLAFGSCFFVETAFFCDLSLTFPFFCFLLACSSTFSAFPTLSSCSFSSSLSSSSPPALPRPRSPPLIVVATGKPSPAALAIHLLDNIFVVSLYYNISRPFLILSTIKMKTTTSCSDSDQIRCPMGREINLTKHDASWRSPMGRGVLY
jgi:hypothetical protein